MQAHCITSQSQFNYGKVNLRLKFKLPASQDSLYWTHGLIL